MLRQMTIQPVRISPLKEAMVLFLPTMTAAVTPAAPYGATLSNVPVTWRFCTPPKAAADPTDAEFSRVVAGDVTLPSEAAVDAYLAAGRDYFDFVDDRAGQVDSDQPIMIGEVDVAKKITIQKGRRRDGFLGRLGTWPKLDIDHSAIDEATRGGALFYARRFTELGITPLVPFSDEWRAAVLTNPIETNAGWPTFVAGPGGKLGTAALGGTGPLQQVLDESAEIAAHFSLDQGTAQCFGLGFRAGPMYKLAPDWSFSSTNRWVAHQEVAGAWPRARHIFMGPFTNNIRLLPLWAAFQQCHKATPGYQRAAGADDAFVATLLAQGFKLYEADISGYDQAVSRYLQESVARAFSSQPALRGWATQFDEWLYWEGRAVITPSWGQPVIASGRAASLVGTEGGTHSGVKTTAVIGSIINTCITRWVLTKLGFILGGSGPNAAHVLIQGDDTIIAIKGRLDEAAWTDLWASLGFKTTLLRGVRFLMKHRTHAGPFAVGARVIQNTGSPEYPNTGEHAFGLNLVGLLGRLADPVHPSVAPQVHTALSSIEWYSRLGAASIADVPTIINRDYGAVMAAALASTEGQSLARRLYFEAEYSSSAATLLTMLRQRGYNIADPNADSSWFADITSRLLLASPRQRMIECKALLTDTFSGVKYE